MIKCSSPALPGQLPYLHTPLVPKDNRTVGLRRNRLKEFMDGKEKKSHYLICCYKSALSEDDVSNQYCPGPCRLSSEREERDNRVPLQPKERVLSPGSIPAFRGFLLRTITSPTEHLGATKHRKLNNLQEGV